MSIKHTPLPFAPDSLEPYISKQTVELHHGKHHKGYVDKLNKLIDGTPLQDKPLEEIILDTADDIDRENIFNNAAQAWNHTVYWHSLAPKGGGKPNGPLLARLEKDFGGFDKFRKAFMDKAVGCFGSGWAWLVENGGRLKVLSTSNAVPPIVFGQKVLLTFDVWEHAYYLDYQNRRAEYVEAFFDHLVNWNFAAQQTDSSPAEALRAVG
ncbi:MAG: superoxide dismutase [Rhodospirillales bacterium]